MTPCSLMKTGLKNFLQLMYIHYPWWSTVLSSIVISDSGSTILSNMKKVYSKTLFNPVLHSRKRASCNKSVDILRQLVTTSRHQDAVRMVCDSLHVDVKSVANCHQSCCKLVVQTCYCWTHAASCFRKLYQVCK